MTRYLLLILTFTLTLKGTPMADRYTTTQEDFKGHTVYVLTDSETGQEARVLPSIGNNCYSYKIRKGDGQIELLWVTPDPETLQGRASGYGIPILFPWPNRIAEGKFTFDGKAYQLETPGPGEHASHGFVHTRPWQVASSGASDTDGAWLTSVFQSVDFPEIGKHFPFPFEARVTYRIKDGALVHEFEGKNVGDHDMPMGLGTHPYFPLPLTESGNRDLCTVQMPADTYWPVGDDPIPTGEILPVDDTIYDVRQPTPLKDLYYDNVWSGVTLTDGWSRCDYVDPIAGVKISMEADDVFRELVLYAPDSRPIVCFEPYTCVTNAVNLEPQGIDAGLMRVKPNEGFHGVMRIVGEVIK
jgi:aldose 1-epimerase